MGHLFPYISASRELRLIGETIQEQSDEVKSTLDKLNQLNQEIENMLYDLGWVRIGNAMYPTTWCF